LQADKPMQRSTLAGNESYPNMVLIPRGTFRMGSDEHYPEEAPVHRVTVDAFRIDKTPLTNRQFKEFVRATGHVKVAEMIPDRKDYPPTPCRICLTRDRWCSRLRTIRSTSRTGANGGHCAARAGAVPMDRKATSMSSTATRWFMSPMPMRSPRKSSRRPRAGQLRCLPAAHQDSPKGPERRLAPVRAKLLPPVSPGCTARRADRYFHQSCWIPVRRSGLITAV
jgi:Sulfatase-modifying factor enzyme 1